jgi:tryptophanyl-tRNA synthetase
MANSVKVTPWEVSGEVDYSRLIKEFGLGTIDKQLKARLKKLTKEDHFMIRRGIFFAHRDLPWLLDQQEKGNQFFLYTGIGPSGPIHFGHIQTWIFTKWLQDKFNCELWFQFTDDEKYLMKDKTYNEIQSWLKENMLDIAALGFSPKKTHFLIDTHHASLMYPEAIKVAKKITFSMAKSTFGFTNETNVGASFYTAMQAVPAFLPSIIKKKKMPCLIPHAVDQDPYFRLTRDILPKLGYPKPASIQCTFLPALTGPKGKMSSTQTNQVTSIFTTDSPKEVETKINKYAFSGGKDTIEEHRKKGGNPDADVSYQYLKMLFEPDDKKLQKIHDDYRSGSLLTSELKQILIEKINTFLKQHQKSRSQASKNIKKYIYKA